MNIKLLHAYRTLTCYKDRDITGKDCSNLDINNALSIVLDFVKEHLDKEEEVEDIIKLRK